jgi:hypothetical protein
VWRWTERTNASNTEEGGVPSESPGFFANNGIPDTLRAVLRHAAEDLVPETEATAHFLDEWLEAHEDVREGAVLERGLGLCRFEFRGRTLNALAQPYRMVRRKAASRAAAQRSRTASSHQ